MVGKSRYCYSPAVFKKIGYRLTLSDRFNRWRHRNDGRTDVGLVTGYFPAVWIRH